MSSLKTKISHMFYFHKKKMAIGAVAAVVLIIAGFVFLPSMIESIQESQQTRNENRNIEEFLAMPRENFIYDFEYLMTTLEENWPFFDLSISVNGVNVNEIADNFRTILNDDSIHIDSPHHFLDLLREHFIWPIGQLGHLLAWWQYEIYFDSIEGIVQQASILGNNADAVNSIQLELLERDEVRMFYTLLRNSGGSALINSSQNIRTRDDLPAFETDIIEEDKIAILTANIMLTVEEEHGWSASRMAHNESIIYNFYREIADYEHLIIDLRGNPGGMNFYFDMHIISPLLDEIISLPAYFFRLDGQYAQLLAEVFPYNAGGEAYRPLVPREDEQNLPFLNSTFSNANSFHSNYVVAPSRYYDENLGWRSLLSYAENPLNFNGRLWVLVDDSTASAAESAAALLKYSEFATVVGDATSGLFGTSYDPTSTFASLPNTGIIIRMDTSYFTDTQGRSLQGYGVTPNYFNRLNMNALETVLEMISETNE